MENTNHDTDADTDAEVSGGLRGRHRQLGTSNDNSSLYSRDEGGGSSVSGRLSDGDEVHHQHPGCACASHRWVVLLLSPRRPSTGNTSTIDRIETSLEEDTRLKVIRADTNDFDSEYLMCHLFGKSSHSVVGCAGWRSSTESIESCSDETKLKELNAIVAKQRVDLIIGLHAIHAGRFVDP